MGVRFDGAPLSVSSIGAELPMDPGTYTLVTTAPGREERSYEVVLKDTAHVKLTVEPGKRLAEPVRAAPRVSTGPTYMQAIGLAAGGVGLTGLVIGAATGVIAIQKKGDAASLCPDPTRCQGKGLEASGSGHALASVSTASFAVGAAGVAAGVVLFLVGRERPSAAEPRPVAIAPWALPGSAGVAAQGRF
jgi:hypothetical protein